MVACQSHLLTVLCAQYNWGGNNRLPQPTEWARMNTVLSRKLTLL